MKILVMDYLFPCLLGSWRTTELNWLLSQPDFEVDILVNNFAYVRDRKLNPETEVQKYFDRYAHLDGYHFLIFDPKLNGLQRFNSTLDGTVFNGQYSADFLLTRRTTINWSDYDLGYCLFLECRLRHRSLIEGQTWPMVTKIYPGGGFEYDDKKVMNRLMLMGADQVITTQPAITRLTRQCGFPTLEILGAPTLPPNFTPQPKIFSSTSELHVAFMSCDNGPKKGFDNYGRLVEALTDHPRIIFHVIGDLPPIDRVRHHGMMTPEAMTDLFTSTIDVIVTPLNRHTDPDGFPMNSEAMICGCVPLQCDPQQLNDYYHLTADEGFFVPAFSVEYFKARLLELDADRNRLASMSQKIMGRIFDLLKVERQLEPIGQLFRSGLKRRPLTLNVDLRSLIRDIGGGSSEEKCHYLANFILRHQLKIGVEIGVYRGRCFVACAEAMDQLGGHMTGIEPYQVSEMYQTDCSPAIRQALATFLPTLDLITMEQTLRARMTCGSLIRKTSLDAVNDVPLVLDFLNIDGNHDTASIILDLLLYVPKVRAGGWILLEVLDWETTRVAQTVLSKIATLKVNYYYWGLWQKNEPSASHDSAGDPRL